MSEVPSTTRALPERKRDPSVPLFMGVGPQKRRRLRRRRQLGLAQALPSEACTNNRKAPSKVKVVDLTGDNS
jgi:hypothetical protein